MTAVPCPAHPDRRLIGTCARCGTFFCAQCSALTPDGQRSCSTCAARPVELELAGRGVRFIAHLVDTFAVMAPMIVLVVWNFLPKESSAALESGLSTLALVTSLALLLTQLHLARNGQSIGKRLFQLRVVRTDGGPASLFRIVVLRNAMLFAPRVLLPFIGEAFGLLDAAFIFAPQRRCLHDFIADTKVVDLAGRSR